jgi:type I site-specific restriction-modification system R (restriction) subunit
MRDDWDYEVWAEVEDMDDTTTTKGSQSVVVVEETLTEEEVSGDAAAGFKDTVAQLTKTLESFKSSFDDTQQEMKMELTALSQDVKSLNLQMTTLTILMDEELRQKTLERALILTDLDAFEYIPVEYYQMDYPYDAGASSELAKGVIRRFMLGQGAKIPSAIMNLSYRSHVSYSYKWNEKTDKEKDAMVKEFVDEFVNQISTLIGKQPRIEKVRDMLYPYEIHYD